MEVTECTKLVLDKIQSIEPENATKIIGYLLLNHTHQEIMEYAFGSEQQIHSLIREAKSYLALSPKPIARPEQAIWRPFSSSSPFRVPAPYMTPHSSLDLMPPSYNEIASLEEQLHAINPLALDITSNPFYSLRSHNGLPQFPTKVCQYYYRGYCRHGSYCKFLHDTAYGVNANELLYNDDLLFGSLEQLEVEISELLKASNGMPVSIASLPSMYQEKYGKNLQAEGYLTESQRHGKAGFSLTKLLARLNSVRLIDRPHGQHSVVLAEDAPKFECRGEGNDTGAVLPSSHQIYLTFPAESSFTDEDVMNYFKQFGPVRDVRIPRQEKRMFGFVSFHSSETVRAILSKGHPHHICGSRVLVKPYKEKTRMYDRKYTERAEFPLFYPPQYFDMESELHSMPRVYETSNLVQKQLMREQTAREVERMRFLELQISPKPLTSHSYFNYGIEDLNTLTDHFSPSPIVQNNGSTSDDPISQQMMNKFSDQDSGNVELPDSPFASRFDNKVYTVV